MKNYPNTTVADNEKEFVKMIRDSANSKSNENVEEFLKNSTWENRFTKIMVQSKGSKTLRCLYEKK